MKKLPLFYCVAVLPFSAAGSVVINETWSDGDRTNQDLANNSMAWFSSAGGSTVDDGVGFMTQNTGGGGRHILGYFTDAGSPVALGVGEFLRVDFLISFDFTSGNTNFALDNNDFRMGAWDSQGARVTEDNHAGTSSSNNNVAFENYTGYIFAGGLDSSRSISLRKKNAPSDGILIASTGVYSTLGSTQSDHTSVAYNTIYAGRLEIERTDTDTVTLAYSLDDGETVFAAISRTDSSDPYVSFDTVGFVLGSNVADGYTLSQVQISVIPEPSLFAALAGAAGLGLVLFRRRRR